MKVWCGLSLVKLHSDGFGGIKFGEVIQISARWLWMNKVKIESKIESLPNFSSAKLSSIMVFIINVFTIFKVYSQLTGENVAEILKVMNNHLIN